MVFAVTALGAFMASLDLSIVNVAFPALQHSFPHDSRATLAWVITAYTIVFASLLVTAGRTADRLGRRRMFFAGLGVFTLGSALCALAPSVPLLIGGRVVQGVGAAAMVPSSVGLLLGAFPVERRSQIVALWGGVGALAVATGPIARRRPHLGGRLAVGLLRQPPGRPGWPGSWAGGSWSESRARERPRPAPTTPAWPCWWGRWPPWCWPSPKDPAGVGAAPGSWPASWSCPSWRAVFLYRSARHPEPVLDLSLFSARSFSVTNAAVVLYAMGFYAMLLGNVLFLTGVWHYSIMKAGLAITPGRWWWRPCPGPAGRLAGRVGFRAVLVTGSALLAGGLLWYATRVGVQPAYLTEWLPATLRHRAGDRPDLPGHERGGGVQPARAPLRRRQRRQPDRPPGRRLARDRRAGGGPGRAGRPRPAPCSNFHHLWLFAATTAGLSGAVAMLLGPPAPASAPPRAGDRGGGAGYVAAGEPAS